MIKKNWVYIVFIIAVLVFILSKLYKKNNYYDKGKVELEVKTYKTDIGWGYDITANDTSLIHQNIIPGIAGRKGFATKEDAEKKLSKSPFRFPSGKPRRSKPSKYKISKI